MVPTHCEDPALLDGAVHIDHKISDSSANIDYQRSQLLLIFFQHGLRRSKRIDDHIGRLKLQFLYASNRILNSSANAINNVKIRFKFFSEESYWIQNAVLTIHVIVLDDRVKNTIFHRQTDFSSV